MSNDHLLSILKNRCNQTTINGHGDCNVDMTVILKLLPSLQLEFTTGCLTNARAVALASNAAMVTPLDLILKHIKELEY